MNTLSNTTYVSLQGNTLAYYDSFVTTSLQTDKPVIVLLHGYCGSSAYFEQLIPLIESVARVIAIDLPGHGLSDQLNREIYPLEEQAETIISMLSTIGVHKYHLFGHSLGGYITLAVANKKPTALVSYGLLHSTALPDSEQAKQNRALVKANIEAHGVAVFVEQLASKLLAEGHPQYEELKQRVVSIGVETKAEAIIGFAAAMRERPQLTDVIYTSQLPVLLVSGAQDRIVQAEGTFAGHNESTVCEVIADAGHMGMLETPEQLAHIIKHFVAAGHIGETTRS